LERDLARHYLVTGDLLLAEAARLAAKAGVAAPIALTRLDGGKNNRVFRADLASGEAAVLKCYFHDPRDPRDRLGAEWAFLCYAWERGVRATPQPLARDRERHLGLYSFATGRKLNAHEIGAREVDGALGFILDMNAPPRAIARFAPGSEACFSISEHLATVGKRVARLTSLAPGAPMRAEAEALVHGTITPLWRDVRARIEAECAQAGLQLDARIEQRAECISPSDFGFHNALMDVDGGATFIDFEYAGRDDPAKLASDFFCCPELPVPATLHRQFVGRLCDGLGLDDLHRARCHVLLDAYRIKWACIMLNQFVDDGAARRAFANVAADARRNALQIARAKAKLEEVGAT
jgi:hypothetical protein